MAKAEVSHVNRVMETIESRQQAAMSSVAASWCRSVLRHGLDPARNKRQELLDSAEITRLHDAHGDLLHIAGAVLDGLYRNVGLAGCCVILTNADGTVLASRSGGTDADFFDSAGLTVGANWSEATEGTNGIGTCLVESRPVTIHRDEHFAARNIDVSCMDAPLFDPDGQLVGALDISSGRRDHGVALAALVSALVQDAARQIERDYFCHRYADARIIYAAEAGGRGNVLLAADGDDLVIGATRAARQQFKLGRGDFSAPRPVSDIVGAAGPAGFRDSERTILRQALARSGGNVAASARALGIGRATFYRRMERAGLAAGH